MRKILSNLNPIVGFIITKKPLGKTNMYKLKVLTVNFDRKCFIKSIPGIGFAKLHFGQKTFRTNFHPLQNLYTIKWDFKVVITHLNFSKSAPIPTFRPKIKPLEPKQPMYVPGHFGWLQLRVSNSLEIWHSSVPL
jgi:hypothetical protein